MQLRRAGASEPRPAAPAGSRVVHCCHCGGAVRVSSRAISVGCPHCNQRITTEDFLISGTFAGRSLTTCGCVTVDRDGRISAPIRADQVTVRGLVQAAITTNHLRVESGGRVVGHVQAARLEVAEGAIITGTCKILRFHESA